MDKKSDILSVNIKIRLLQSETATPQCTVDTVHNWDSVLSSPCSWNNSGVHPQPAVPAGLGASASSPVGEARALEYRKASPLIRLSEEKKRDHRHSHCEQHRTTLRLGRSLYHFQEAIWWGFRADWHSFTNKKSRFVLIPELWHWAATTVICPVKLLPETNSKV